MSDAILSGTAAPPSQFVPSAPPEIEHIIARAMARSLDYRYRDAGELCRDLRNFQLQMSHISTAPLPLPSRPAPHAPTLAPRPPATTGRPHPHNPLHTAPPAPASSAPSSPYPSQPTQRMPGANTPYQEPPRRQRDEW